MVSIQIAIEDGESTTLIKIDNCIRIHDEDVEDLDIPININLPFNQADNANFQALIQHGATPQFARFSVVWNRFFQDVLTEFICELTDNDIEYQLEFFERLAFELWKPDSRLVDGDRFILTETAARCENLATAVDLQNVEVMLDALLVSRN
jgi:hypothetical protein